ncbi:MAG: ABC transporter ATP-binding protein [Acidobacteriota bacterium]
MTLEGALAWPEERLTAAIPALARAAGLAGDRSAHGEGGGEAEGNTETNPAAIAASAQRAGVEAWPVSASYRDVDHLLSGVEPLLLRSTGNDRWLAILGGGARVRLVSADGSIVRLPARRLAAVLRAPLEDEGAHEVEALLERAGVPARRRPRAGRALLSERLRGEPCVEGWSLRLPPGARTSSQLRRAGLFGRLGRLAIAHAASWVLLITSWAVLGRGVLEGRLDPGWLVAWALLLVTLIPLQAVALWSEGTAALGAGALLKHRLLAGSLRLDPEEIRDQGAGELLGKVMEAERVEDLALGGGFTAMLAIVEIALAAGVLALGAGGALHALLLVGWLFALGVAGWRLYLERRGWAEERVGMTDHLVERLLGQRTRLVQESREHWHDAEDAELESYLQRSRRLDRLMPRIQIFATRGWLLAALLALAPALLSGGTSAASVAIALGGILLAARGLQGVAGGLSSLTAAAVAWRQVASLYGAATRREPEGSPEIDSVAEAETRDADAVVLTAQGIDFRYPGRGRRTLDACGLELRSGDRVLLSGDSGSGKSTLISLLAALRRPQAGVMLLRGADLHAWGAIAWHRRVAAAPQFHDNHLFAAPLAFNLLLGRNWPPSPEDLAVAGEICDELGLGELITRMPAGLMQPIGESGWRLSHGEASRVYLARVLLQEPDIVLLDESFAALDPASLETALGCARRRANTLLIATHD